MPVINDAQHTYVVSIPRQAREMHGRAMGHSVKSSKNSAVSGAATIIAQPRQCVCVVPESDTCVFLFLFASQGGREDNQEGYTETR
jgi:hypothetical protein